MFSKIDYLLTRNRAEDNQVIDLIQLSREMLPELRAVI